VKISEVPVGVVVTIGHPANRILAAKGDNGWRWLSDGTPVEPEAFRAGWDLFSPTEWANR
jgi:hypothetical protein